LSLIFRETHRLKENYRKRIISEHFAIEFKMFTTSKSGITSIQKYKLAKNGIQMYVYYRNYTSPTFFYLVIDYLTMLSVTGTI
jgi:hypothetical protein